MYSLLLYNNEHAAVPSVFLMLVMFFCFVLIPMRAELCKLCWLSYEKKCSEFLKYV